MTNDIVARLREEGFVTHMARLPRESKILHDAADEIERLRELSGEAGQLRAQRDEARAEARLLRSSVCLGAPTSTTVGWSCFKGADDGSR